MPTNTPSCTPKASGKTMETKSVCDLAPWFLGRTPYFGLSMTLWLEQRSSHFWWTLCRTWWVSLACRNLIFFGEIQDLGLNLCPFLSSACFFLRKKKLWVFSFFPMKVMKVCLFFVSWLKRATVSMVNWQLGRGPNCAGKGKQRKQRKRRSWNAWRRCDSAGKKCLVLSS